MPKKLKSILKGDQEDQFKLDKEDFQKVEKESKSGEGFLGAMNGAINGTINGTINGNIVHVTVNNFISTEKKNAQ